jgi:hypothetical protein
MNRPNDEPEILRLDDLETEFYRLHFLVDTGNTNIKKEMEISLQAGNIVGVLYDALLEKYNIQHYILCFQLETTDYMLYN